MLRKDYIQRQFEEFGKVLASLLTKKKNKDWEAFEKEIAEAVQQFTALELDSIETASVEDFVTKINSAKLEFDQKKILANLLFEKMNFVLEKDPESYQDEIYRKLKAKCILLYQDITNDLTHNEFDLEIHYRLEFLKKE